MTRGIYRVHHLGRSRGFAALPFVLLFLASAVAALEPANPNANAKARSILAFMASREGQTENGLISGQFLEFEAAVSTNLLTAIEQQTGQWPAMAGADYMDWSKGISYTKSNEALKYAWKNGCLVNVCVHNPNPSGGPFKEPTFDLNALLKPGTPIYQRYYADLDKVAQGLQDLQNAGVVVLYRPLHEMNGNWFWWGAKDPKLYIAVWKQMFDYFTHTKKLNNLLWVFAPNIGDRTAEYYPGDAYCDIVGLDAYTSNITLAGIKGYTEMAKLPKPFGLTEYGPEGAGGASGNFDYRILVNGLKTHLPRMTFVLAWSGPWAISNSKFAREALNDPYVANRDDITDAFKAVSIRAAFRPTTATPGVHFLSRDGRASGAIRILSGHGVFDASGKHLPVRKELL